ncbi:PAS domain-containing protein [Rhizobium sp. ARZ01]|uniref:PAS domain-containing protein n=1 Tax=Rhizobium sp. ARZ01 TaxID=2769313 RepID=UPI00177E4FF0|nr:PAS domain-containing protein [Rhizobium sp. ARZ01]MBD9372760.1 PAS domain-containing protein [Rhizobium sp. ARZ01]
MTDPRPESTAPGGLLIDWIDQDGRVAAINDREARELGVDAQQIVGQALERIYGSNSAQLIKSVARGERLADPSFPVWMNSAAYDEVPMVATAYQDGARGLAVVKQVLSPATLGIGPELNERVEILSQMIGAATEACWCIEFLEPVDISLAEEEIVDRIFTNQSRWRACNEAMARLYNVPEGLDFNTQPVSRYFPDTAVNRAMVRDLVRSNYRLDHAAAVDQRHDGSEMLVENDFRAAIKDGFLIRLWGTTRDIGPHKLREQQLFDRATAMLDILSAAPDPILVIAEDGLLLAANPAAETAWGRAADQTLGRPIQDFVETRNALSKLRHASLEDEDGESECDLTMIAADNGRDIWRFRVAGIEGEMRRYVLTARRKSRRRVRALLSEVAS